MFNKFIFLLFSAFWALTTGLVIHRQEGVESTVAELVRLAEEKGGRVMDSIAGNLIWIVVVCSAALGGISFAYWFLRRLCDRRYPAPGAPAPARARRFRGPGRMVRRVRLAGRTFRNMLRHPR